MRVTSTTGSLLLAGLLAAATAHAQEAAPAEPAAPTEAAAPRQPAPSAAPAPGGEPRSLFELLELVEQGLEVETEENRRREQRFLQAKQDQERLLAEAKQQLADKEAVSQRLEEQYNTHEVSIAENQARLTERLGQLGELFGVVRQVATDAGAQIWDSLTSSQLGTRKELFDRLGRSTELPTTRDLERLWYELSKEMTEQGQVVRYRAPVLTLQGQVEEKEVVRAGPFSAVADGKYLMWEPKEGKLRELTRQPPSKYLNTVGDLEDATSGYTRFALDPSRGSLLSALTDTPNATERVQQGGYVGYVIIILGLMALALGLFRWVGISIASRGVSAQRKSDYVNSGNPLGRVLSVFEDNRQADAETLELKLDEAVLRETSQLQRYLWIVKTVSVVAPLLGLLGTVTGMIQTFQAITLFGAGDPKMMAGGISEALVTTMLGLITAIPLVLLYDTLANSSRRVIDILDEQSAGLIAARSARDSAGS